MSTGKPKPCKSRGLASQRRQQSTKIMPPPVTFDPFITSTSLSKPNTETRKLIRSHVMRGKNTRKPKVHRSELWTTRNMQLSRSHEKVQFPGPQTLLSDSALSGMTFAVETTPYIRDMLCTCESFIVPFSEFIAHVHTQSSNSPKSHSIQLMPV